MSTSVTISEYWRLARDNRNFRRLWLAQIVSEIGDWFYVVAIYSLLLELTGKASSLALALALQVLTQTFVGPLAGVINDRVSRKKVMISADLVRAGIVASMLLVRSSHWVWLLYLLLLAESVMATFFEPARNSVIPNVTSSDDVIVANTLSSTTWSFNLAIGTTIGGLVAAFLGRDAVFLLNSASFLVSALLISGMHFVEPHLENAAPLGPRDLFGFNDMVEGVRYIGRDRRLLATVLLKGGLGLAGATWVIFPVMGRMIFPLLRHGFDFERAAMFSMSLLMGARGVGALIGPLVMAPWAGREQERLRRGILIGFLFGATGYSLLGFAPALWLACLCVIIAHFGFSTVWVFSTTLIHLNTDDRFRGRVFAADLGIAMLMIAMAGWAAGGAMDAGVTPRLAASCLGFLVLLPAIAWGRALRWWRPEAERQAATSD